MNNFYLIGRLVDTPTTKTTDNGVLVSNITVAVPRAYKNEEGIYETDFVDCTLWNEIARRTSEYCQKGDLILVRGRIQTNVVEREGEKKKFTDMIAEKISFISSKKKEMVQSHEDNEYELEK